jgi:hypothetical protein
LHTILAEARNQAIAFGIDLQPVDGLMQIKLAAFPEIGARPTPQLESREHIDASRGDGMVQRGGHGLASPSAMSVSWRASMQTKPYLRSRRFNKVRNPRL